LHCALGNISFGESARIFNRLQRCLPASIAIDHSSCASDRNPPPGPCWPSLPRPDQARALTAHRSGGPLFQSFRCVVGVPKYTTLTILQLSAVPLLGCARRERWGAIVSRLDGSDPAHRPHAHPRTVIFPIPHTRHTYAPTASSTPMSRASRAPRPSEPRRPLSREDWAARLKRDAIERLPA
jgi:hypothetical protein